eukprot:182074_1
MAEQKSSDQLQITKFDYNEMVQIKEETQILGVVGKNKLLVAKTEKKYYEINVTDAMKKLASCGQLIQLAYASTDGFKAQADVGELLSNYSTLVKTSYIASAKFVNASISALGYHKLALKILKKKPAKSVVFLGKCAQLADEMANVAGELSIKAELLVVMATKALKQAITDKNISSEEKKKIEAAIAEAETAKKESEKLRKTLQENIKRAKEEEAKAVKTAEDERSKKFTLDIIKGIAGPLTSMTMTGALSQGVNAVAQQNVNAVAQQNDEKGGNDDEQGGNEQGAEGRAILMTKRRMDLQDHLMAKNEELAKTVASLSGFKGKENQLQRALTSLEIAVKTLGRIKVIFSNTQLFWEGVKANCKEVAKIGNDVQEYAEDAEIFEDEIKEAIVESTLNWFVLAKVNYFAKIAIVSVDKKMDSIMEDLPDEAQAMKLVDELSITMTKELREENKQLKAIQQEEK